MAAALCGTSAAASDAPSAFAKVRAHAQAQVRALGPNADATFADNLPGPALIAGLQVPTTGDTPERRALGFLQDHADLWGIAPDQLAVLGKVAWKGHVSVRLAQSVPSPWGRLPLLERIANVTLDDQSRVMTVTSDLLPVALPPISPVSAERARAAAAFAAGLCAKDDLPCGARAPVPVCKLAVVASALGAQLVWAAEVRLSPVQRVAVLVDAKSGLPGRAQPLAVD